jgi:uncharacterized membrane protein (TIGR02234 family)
MRNSKRNVLFVVSSGALIALAAWTQAWFVFSTSEGVAVADVTVAGTQGQPLVSALAIGALAAVGALLLAGHAVRFLILVLTFVLGVSGIVAVSTAAANPVAASLSSLSSLIGVVDIATVAQAVKSTTVTAWPWVSTFGFALVCLGVVLGLFSTRGWNRPTQRFNRPEIEADSSRSRTSELADDESWDSLSRGEDPTR